MKMTKNNTIKCPNCGEEINIESLIQAGAKDELDKQLALQQTEFNKKYNELKAQNSALSEKYEQEKRRNLFNSRIIGCCVRLVWCRSVQSVCTNVVTFRDKNDKHAIHLLVNCIDTDNYNAC